MILTRRNVIFMGENFKWSCTGLREHSSLRCNAHNPRSIRPTTSSQYSARQARPTFPRVLTVIFATTISRAESDPANEYLHRKTENRDLGDLAGPVTSEEKTRGFRKAAAAEAPLRWAPSPCPAVASRRPKIMTGARPGKEAPSHCQALKKIIYISRISVTLEANEHLRDNNVPKAIPYDELHDDWRCQRQPGQTGGSEFGCSLRMLHDVKMIGSCVGYS